MAALWLTLVIAGLITFAIRLSLIALLGKWELSAGLRRALRYVPVAVFSAIIMPDLLLKDGQAWIALTNPRLAAGLVAILVAWRTRNTLLTILVGMAALLALQALL